MGGFALLKGDLRPPRHRCPSPGKGNPKDQREVPASKAGERSSKPPHAADAVGNGAGEQAEPWEGGTATASLTEPDPHAAAAQPGASPQTPVLQPAPKQTLLPEEQGR